MHDIFNDDSGVDSDNDILNDESDNVSDSGIDSDDDVLDDDSGFDTFMYVYK